MIDLTIALTVYNKESWISNLLCSWLDTLSGEYTVEVVAVFDGCEDDSFNVVMGVMDNHPNIQFVARSAPDVHEIVSNNMALDVARGEYIVFVQDDNWMFDRHWDATLISFLQRSRVGLVGLLAGVGVAGNEHLTRTRVECWRSGKDKTNFGKAWDMGVYQVDCAIRPFAGNTALIRTYGLGQGFDTVTWDDVDLSLRLQQAGYENYYLPFNVLNKSTIAETFDQTRWRQAFAHNFNIVKRRHQKMLAQKSPYTLWAGEVSIDNNQLQIGK